MSMITAIILFASALNAKSSTITVEPNVQPWDYVDTNDGAKLQGFYSIPEGEGPFPAVIILP